MNIVKNNETIANINLTNGLTKEAFIRELAKVIKTKIGRSQDKVLTNDAINKVLQALKNAKANSVLQFNDDERKNVLVLYNLYVEYIRMLKPQTSIMFLCDAVENALISDGSRHDRSVLDDNLLDDLLAI